MINEILQAIYSIINRVQLTESGIAGKVNFIGMIFVGTVGVIQGNLLSDQGITAIVTLVGSAVASDIIRRASNALNRVLRFLETEGEFEKGSDSG
jgi:hypothetical protein